MPPHLVRALNDHSNLVSLHVWLHMQSTVDWNQLNYFDSCPKSLSLVIDGRPLSMDVPDPAWPPRKCFTDTLSYTICPFANRDERLTPLAWRKSRNPSTSSGPGLESLVLHKNDVRLWQKHDLSQSLDLRRLKRLALDRCNNPMSISWHCYPQDLERLEIADPVQTYPIRVGLLLTENLFAKPLFYFHNLEELSLQNVGAPICEVLINLCERGNKLKVLQLQDQEVSGIDQVYKFRRKEPRGDSDYLDCPFHKLLVHICPNVEILSLDISINTLEQGFLDVYLRGSDSRSPALEPLLEELGQTPTLPVYETFRSLQRLRSLQLTMPEHRAARNEQIVLSFAEKLWSKDLEYFGLAIRSTPSIEDCQDIFRVDRNGASYLDCGRCQWNEVPGFSRI